MNFCNKLKFLLLACLSSLVYCLRVRPELTNKHQNRLEWPARDISLLRTRVYYVCKRFLTLDHAVQCTIENVQVLSDLTLNYYIRLKSNQRPSLFAASVSDEENGSITLTLFEIKYIFWGKIVKACFCLSLISH